jgi:Domain of unknown function (DUF3459)
MGAPTPHRSTICHRKLIGLRRARPALTSGVYRGLPSGESSGDLLLFLRAAQNERLLVDLNFGARRLSPAL